ncbi:8-oxo-dGTP pyrophosphatase MutT and related house-cleaning NTP pyrophosphohydrolases [Commensalibacter communis]|uniref:GDP-mannose pyrophosphatase n=1 Tax=Commensalibacter communis TaxID=2972786 RepID=A0A9W4TLW1_9PROT|nr:NUDIX hydrolase [Commensalibacter communis]CAI3938039.1 8-oxo-dGTP pyrophosphatase MutT and related house-cleaning NTP pyrophosphohydrolases [Commensalibacter communis]CAI3938246.1 8-oxo-dGTP pyrophosphatase MutT and related house-cleaning NTP pyrophosphohydrolases [Commensalibacter communis]CAI3940182.1 8-oxo-dGTP pyrophosphatase MutT and related house-cleaning NTP pyrophosphohydrolases [Commensalibacter communis]CAI3941416.1 8-oxo-dGTP pyrophosphatase MutT and related house-cleaning NTP py
MTLKKIIGQPDAGGITPISSRIAYENRWLKIREDIIKYPNDLDGMFGVVERNEFAVILPLHIENNEKTVTLIRQYRYPVGEFMWELPMGMWELKPDATPEMVAMGELEEETGLRAKNMIHAGSFYQGAGYSTQKGHVFLATDLTQHTTNREATEQNMTCHSVPLVQFEQMIETGEITCMVTIAAFCLLRSKKLV